MLDPENGVTPYYGTQEKRITLPPGDGPVKPLLFKQLGPQGVERGGSGHGGEGGGDPATRGVQRKRAHVEGVPMATRTLVLVITVPVCIQFKSIQIIF